MISIFQYESPHEFMRDHWEQKRKANRHFTIRAWAQKMGMKNHGFLHDMIKGNRKIPKARLPRLIQEMSLDTNEGLYFESMVDLSRSRTVEEKTLYLERMKALSFGRRTIAFNELESFRLLCNPLHLFISEMVFLPDFKPEADWIQKRLLFKATRQEIEQAIERLIQLDILREDAQGQLKRMNDFISSRSDIKDLALQEYHKNLSDLAKIAVESQDILDREFQGMTMNFNPDDMPEAKLMIRDFITKFLARFDQTTSEKREVCHLNLQFFNVTNNKGVSHV